VYPRVVATKFMTYESSFCHERYCSDVIVRYWRFTTFPSASNESTLNEAFLKSCIVSHVTLKLTIVLDVVKTDGCMLLLIYSTVQFISRKGTPVAPSITGAPFSHPGHLCEMSSLAKSLNQHS